MQDYYIKTTSEHELWTKLSQLGLARWIEEIQQYEPMGINLDIIGTVYKPTGKMITTAEGFNFPEQLPLDGFHANIRGTLTEEQHAALPLIAAPATPYRVWA